MIERPATTDDVPGITALWQRFEVATRGFTETDEAGVRGEWDVPGFDLERDTRLLVDGPDVVGYAACEDAGHADTCADPGRRGEGLEDRLLDWLAEYAAARAVPHLQHYWGADDDEAAERFTRHGWQPARTFWRMRVELDGELPEPVWPDGVGPVDLDPDRHGRTAHEIVRTAFADIGDGSGQRSYEEWELFVLAPERFVRGLALVAEEGGEMVAVSIGQLLPDGVGFVRQLAVPRAHRGRGLALALLHETFRRCAARGLSAVVLGVDAANATGAVRLYERAGMRVVERFTRWDRHAVSPG